MTIDRAELVSRLRNGRDEYLRHCDAPADDLSKTYAPGKWTVRMMLAHLADCETAYGWRFLRAAGEPRSPVEAFDENAWADRLDYETRPVAVSKATFLGLRTAFIHWIETLPEDRLASQATHPERGLVAAFQFASLTANHARHHCEQVDAARRGVPWEKRGRVMP